jgi:hypothetical protein
MKNYTQIHIFQLTLSGLYKILHHVKGQGLCGKPIRASDIC